MTETREDGFAVARVGRSAAIVTVAVAFGQVFGVGRELFVAAQVGTSPRLDALLVALVVPSMLSGFLMSGSSTALVPAHASIEREAGHAEAQRFTSAILTWTLLVALAAMVVVIGLGAGIIALTGPGLSPVDQEAGVRFLTIVAPIIVFGSMAGLLSAVLQVAGRFGPISIASSLGPVASFVVTIAGWSALGLAALALGTTVAMLVTMVVLGIGALRFGLLSPPTLRARRRYAVDFVRHALPLWASALTLQFNVLVDRAVSSLLAVGAVSALRFGEGIIRLPLASISPAWGIVLYPALVREAHTGSRGSLGEAAGETFRYVFAIFMPLSVATAALAPLIVDVVYRRGAFGADAAAMTTAVTAALAAMIVITMAEPIVVGAHNARRAGTLLLTAGVANTAIHAVLAIVLGLSIGVAGVALSTTISMAAVYAFLAVRLARVDPGLDLRGVAVSGLRSLVASLVPGIPIALWAWFVYRPAGFVEGLAMLLVLSLVGLVGYVLTASRIGLEEPLIVLRALRARLRPSGSPA